MKPWKKPHIIAMGHTDVPSPYLTDQYYRRLIRHVMDLRSVPAPLPVWLL